MWFVNELWDDSLNFWNKIDEFGKPLRPDNQMPQFEMGLYLNDYAISTRNWSIRHKSNGVQ